MVWDYLNVTDNPETSREFIAEVIWQLDEEFKFWMDRMVNVSMGNKTYQLARYRVEVDGPRPGKRQIYDMPAFDLSCLESYEEDYTQAAKLPEAARKEWYVHMKSGAESGWDYSSRWFVTDGKRSGEDELLDVYWTPRQK